MLKLLRELIDRRNAILTPDQCERLLENGRRRQRHLAAGVDKRDFVPVVKVFTPDAGCTWLLTEIDPEEPDLAFGLCDLGIGLPELGYVRFTELEAVRGQKGMPVKRDRRFKPEKTIEVYAEEARNRARSLIDRRGPLLTDDIRKRLLENGGERKRRGLNANASPSIEDRRLATIKGRDFVPVVKLFITDATCSWLLTELDPEEPDIAFGLCDLGMGYPEFGHVSVSELESVRGPTNLPIERDQHFAATYPLSAYARAAYTAKAISEDEEALARAAAALAADRSVSE